MDQTFNAAVHGGISGRDYYSFHGETKPESQLQSEFATRTGIWCPKGAREWFEELLDKDGFTVRELALAWRAGSLGWSAKTNERRIATPLFEPFGAGLMISVVMTLQLSILILWGVASPPRSLAMGVVLLGGTAVCFSMLWMVNQSMVAPRRVAIRVRRYAEMESAQAAELANKGAKNHERDETL